MRVVRWKHPTTRRYSKKILIVHDRLKELWPH